MLRRTGFVALPCTSVTWSGTCGGVSEKEASVFNELTCNRAKINEIYSQQKKVVKQHGKVIGGGATASLDNGKLVWD